MNHIKQCKVFTCKAVAINYMNVYPCMCFICDISLWTSSNTHKLIFLLLSMWRLGMPFYTSFIMLLNYIRFPSLGPFPDAFLLLLFFSPCIWILIASREHPLRVLAQSSLLWYYSHLPVTISHYKSPPFFLQGQMIIYTNCQHFPSSSHSPIWNLPSWLCWNCSMS